MINNRTSSRRINRHNAHKILKRITTELAVMIHNIDDRTFQNEGYRIEAEEAVRMMVNRIGRMYGLDYSDVQKPVSASK